MSGQIFKKYYSRIAREGIVKSLLCGLIVGFSILFITAGVFWWVNVKLFWLSILLCALTTVGVAFLFYYKEFKPTTKQIARRVDELGLEERMLTMTELEGDESYIAMRQREDALAALGTVNEKLLSIIVSVPLIIATCVCGIFGVGMTTVTALSAAGVIKSGKEWLDEATALPPVSYELTYEADAEGGIIEGKQFQVVEEGKSGTPVMAVAEDGWAFSEWSDGNANPYRVDENVSENISVVAYFIKLNDSGEGEDVSDEANDLPMGTQDGKPQGGEGGDTGGGEYVPSNQVIDGSTYYGYEYEVAYKDVLELLAQNTEMPEELRLLIANYFETIKVYVDEPTEDAN